MVAFQQFLNRLFVFVLSAILIAAYSYQIIRGREPCSLCFLQRLGMTGIGAAILMNLRFGIRMEHYGLAIISALLGRIVALRQISLHLCPAIPLLGRSVLGFDLYLWSYFIFTCSIFAIALLLIIYGFSQDKETRPHWTFIDKLAFWLFTLITLGNIVNAIIDFQIGFILK